MNDYEFNAKRRFTGRVGHMSGKRLTKNDRIRLRLNGMAFCPRCDRVVELLSFSQAAKSFNTDLQDIVLLAEKGDLHRLHDRRAMIRVCERSLFDFFESRKTRLLDSYFVNSMANSKTGPTN